MSHPGEDSRLRSGAGAFVGRSVTTVARGFLPGTSGVRKPGRTRNRMSSWRRAAFYVLPGGETGAGSWRGFTSKAYATLSACECVVFEENSRWILSPGKKQSGVEKTAFPSKQSLVILNPQKTHQHVRKSDQQMSRDERSRPLHRSWVNGQPALVAKPAEPQSTESEFSPLRPDG